MQDSFDQMASKPIVEALKPWLEASLAKVSKGGKFGEAIRYGLRQRDGLCRFLVMPEACCQHDGRVVPRTPSA